MKKISLFLFLCILMSCFAMPVAFADNTTQGNFLVNMDFDDAQSSIFESIDGIGLPQDADASKIYNVKGNTVSLENNSLKCGNGEIGFAIPFNTTVSGGIIQFDADININSLIYDNSANVYERITFGFVSSNQTHRFGVFNCNKAVYGTRDADIGLGSAFNFAEITHITVVYDIDNHKYTISVKKADGTIKTSVEIDETYNLESVRGIWFKGTSKNAAVYIDNVKVKTVERDLNVGSKELASDNFDKYTAGEFDKSGISYNNNGANPGMSNDKDWITYNNAKMSIKSDDKNNYLFMDDTGESYALLAFDNQVKQLISCEFDTKVESTLYANNQVGTLYVGVGDPVIGDSNNVHVGTKFNCLLLYGTGKSIINCFGDNKQSVGGKYDNRWVHVVFEYDAANDTYSYYITDKNDGSLICKVTDVSRNTPKEKISGTVNTILFRGRNASIDNVKVSNIEASQIKINSAKAISDDFEKGAILMGKNSQAADSALIYDDNGNKVLSMGKSTSAPNQDNSIVHMDYPFKAGNVYTIKFDVKPDEEMVSMLRLNGCGANGADYPVNFAKNKLYSNRDDYQKFVLGFHGNPGFAGYAGNKIVTSGVWYTVTSTVDLVNMKVRTAVATRDHVDGQAQISENGTFTLTNVPTGYEFVLYQVLQSECRTYFDNFELKANGEKINFTNDMVKFIAGAEEISYADGAAALNPDTNKIEITFNTNVNSDSVNNKTVAVYDKKAQKLNTTVAVDNNKVTVTLNEVLLPGNPYTLYVSSAVTGITGTSLANAQQLSFKTGRGSLKATLNHVGTTAQATEYSGGENFNANITVSNGTGEEQKLNVYVAYYDEDKGLYSIEVIPCTVSADTITATTDNVGFTVIDADDALDTSKLTVFVWDGNMKPLTDTISVDAK